MKRTRSQIYFRLSEVTADASNPLVETYQKTLKMVSTASLLGAQHLGEVVENKPESSLVVS